MITTSDLYNKVLTADTILSYGDKIKLLKDASILGWDANFTAFKDDVLVLYNKNGVYIWASQYKWIAADIDNNHDFIGKRFKNHRQYKNIYEAFKTENER